MRRLTVLLASAALVGVSYLPAPASATAIPSEVLGEVPGDAARGAQLTLAAAGASLVFAENRGQWAPDVRFRAEIGGAVLWVTDDAVVYDFSVTADPAPLTDVAGPDTVRDEPEPDAAPPSGRRGQVVAMRFDGGQAARVVGHGEQATYRNYVLGADPAGWASRVPLYDEVVLEDLYAGVDLRLYSEGGLPRYDLVLAPGADLTQVRMRLDGADGVSVSADGTVSMQTSLGPVEQRGLVAYQETPGGRRVVPSMFRLAADGSLGFSADDVDETRPLVVDPLVWSTFLGSTDDFDTAEAIALRPDGSVIVAGDTYSASFPTTPGAYDTTLGSADGYNTDAFVSVLSADGSELLYSTYLGGRYDDSAWAVAAGGDGSITVTGDTDSDDFPVTAGAYDTTFNGQGFFAGADAFVTRLSADGSALVFSTYLGGASDEFTHELAVAANGSPTVAGTTYSVDFPATAGAYDTTFGGDRDGFVARLSADGSSLVFASYLGGADVDGVWGVETAPDGSPTVAGFTNSLDFPVTVGAYDVTPDERGEAYVAQLSPDGGSLTYATYFGGSAYEAVSDFALGPDGSVTIVGETSSTDLPTSTGAYDASHNGRDDGYLARLSAGGRSLEVATYLGGSGYDEAAAVALATDGSVVVAGEAGATSGAAFPTTPDAFDREVGGSADAFVSRLSADGTALLYSTVLGGSGYLGEYAGALALDADGLATVTGFTDSADFPTTPGAFQTAAGDKANAYVTRLQVGFGSCSLSLGAASVAPHLVVRGRDVAVRAEIANAGAGPRVARLDADYVRRPRGPSGTVLLGEGTVPVTDGVAATVTRRVRSDAPPGRYRLQLRLVDVATGSVCDSVRRPLVVRRGHSAGAGAGDRLFEDSTGTALFATRLG